MAAIKENGDEMRRLMEFFLAIGVFFVCINIYWYCYPFFEPWLSHEYAIIVFEKLQNMHLFASTYVTLLIALACFISFAVNEKGRKTPDDILFFFNKKIKIKASKEKGYRILYIGIIIYLISPIVLRFNLAAWLEFILYTMLLFVSICTFLFGSHMVHRILNLDNDDDDYFNEIQQSSFKQCEELIDTPISVNIPTLYRFKKEIRKGWINIVNPFRGMTVMGTPGSGKSFAFINEYIRQHMSKGFAMYVYDFKFPTLTKLAYNEYLKYRNNTDVYPVKPKFRMINFDDPRYSHRINPISAKSLENISDAYQSAYTIMMNLNRSWLQKQGDFFVESPINFLAAVIWYLKMADGGKCCSLAHVVEWCCKNSANIIAVMATHPEIRGYMQPFYEALEKGVYEQLQGQVASVQIPLSRLKSNDMYWVITGNDFALDINDPDAPVILCTGNNPDRQDIYGASLSLINGRLVKRINHAGRLKLSFIVDELPTIFFKGIDVLISTARSNKVAVCLGFQDNSQLIRDYGDKEAKVIIGLPGNIASGQVRGDTSKQLQETFGKNKQHSKSVNTSDDNVSINVSEKEDFMIPSSRISQLSQGNFVGIVSDEVKYPILNKVFCAKVNLDIKKISSEEDRHVDIPQVYDFNDEKSFNSIKDYTKKIVEDKKTTHDVAVFIKCHELGDFTNKETAQKKIRLLKKALKGEYSNEGCAAKAAFKKIFRDIDDIEKEHMTKIMEHHTREIEMQLDELMQKDLERIETDPQFADIKKMLDKIKASAEE